MRALSDLDVIELGTVIDAIKPKCPEPKIASPTDLATEEGRYRLAWAAGRYSLLTDIQGILKLKETEGR